MAWLQSKTDYKITKIHHFLSLAFGKVKQDISYISNWIHYFHNKHQEHDSRLNLIEQQLNYMPKTREEIKNILDNYYSYDSIINRINDINQRLDIIEMRKPADQKTAIKEKIIKKITKNSKNYIKSVIYSLIKKYGRISAPQLKEIVVEEQGLCSKSSFYRLLSELESDNEVGIIRQGKEKLYLYKTAIVK